MSTHNTEEAIAFVHLLSTAVDDRQRPCFANEESKHAAREVGSVTAATAPERSKYLVIEANNF
jgi:hypothetical protein